MHSSALRASHNITPLKLPRPEGGGGASIEAPSKFLLGDQYLHGILTGPGPGPSMASCTGGLQSARGMHARGFIHARLFGEHQNYARRTLCPISNITSVMLDQQGRTDTVASVPTTLACCRPAVSLNSNRPAKFCVEPSTRTKLSITCRGCRCLAMQPKQSKCCTTLFCE